MILTTSFYNMNQEIFKKKKRKEKKKEISKTLVDSNLTFTIYA